MRIDDRRPVIVGVAQVDQKGDPAEGREPLALMEDAVLGALADSGAPLAARIGSIRVVRGIWPYANPAALLARRLGCDGCDTVLSQHGGDVPQAMVNAAAEDIAAGRVDVVVVVTGDTVWSRKRQKRAGIEIPYTADTGVEPPRPFGTKLVLENDTERAAGFTGPLDVYPLFEIARRASSGVDPAGHRTEIANRWARFNEVAVANEHAWNRTPLSAAAIGEPNSGNRMVAFPYTKYLVSNWDVDQAAAVILCAAGTARSLGVPLDRLVFVHAGTSANDQDHFSTRGRLDRSPAIAAAGRALGEVTGVAPDDADHVDLYSCFPSAVDIGATELGLSPGRDLTVTGGLTFAGQPVNGYGLRAIATMVGRLRDENKESLGLTTGNGGFLTRHALTLLGSEPPVRPFRTVACPTDAPARAVAGVFEGPAVLESYTVTDAVAEDRRGLATALLPDGRRVIGSLHDPDDIAALLSEERCGRAVHQAAPGRLVLA